MAHQLIIDVLEHSACLNFYGYSVMLPSLYILYCLRCQGVAVFWTELKNFSFHFNLLMTEFMY